MNDFVSTFMQSYLIMPILAVITGFVAYFMAKKNKLLVNKKLIFYVLLGSVVLCLPALFGFIDYWFMPYIYLSLQVVYLILGYFNILFLKRFLPDLKKEKAFWTILIIQFVMMFIGAAFFSLIFNLCNELQYGLWAATCLILFILPPVLWETYNKYMSIPLEIYKIWTYSDNSDLSSFELMDYNKLLVMEMEIFKTVNDAVPAKIKAKAPDNMQFGTWFHKFLIDYNLKFPLNPIIINDETMPYGWIFYVKRSFFHPRAYIDHELSITENKIKETYTIVAKRVSEHNNTEIK